MAITPNDLLAVGQQLAQDAGEPYHRSAASRLYYAAFHRSIAWHGFLPAPGAVPAKQAGSHQILIHQLNNPHSACSMGTRVRSRKIGMRLDQMRILRKTADYQLAATVTKAECDQQLRAAQAVMTDCDAPLPP